MIIPISQFFQWFEASTDFPELLILQLHAKNTGQPACADSKQPKNLSGNSTIYTETGTFSIVILYQEGQKRFVDHDLPQKCFDKQTSVHQIVLVSSYLYVSEKQFLFDDFETLAHKPVIKWFQSLQFLTSVKFIELLKLQLQKDCRCHLPITALNQPETPSKQYDLLYLVWFFLNCSLL